MYLLSGDSDWTVQWNSTLQIERKTTIDEKKIYREKKKKTTKRATTNANLKQLKITNRLNNPLNDWSKQNLFENIVVKKKKRGLVKRCMLCLQCMICEWELTYWSVVYSNLDHNSQKQTGFALTFNTHSSFFFFFRFKLKIFVILLLVIFLFLPVLCIAFSWLDVFFFLFFVRRLFVFGYCCLFISDCLVLLPFFKVFAKHFTTAIAFWFDHRCVYMQLRWNECGISISAGKLHTSQHVWSDGLHFSTYLVSYFSNIFCVTSFSIILDSRKKKLDSFLKLCEKDSILCILSSVKFYRNIVNKVDIYMINKMYIANSCKRVKEAIYTEYKSNVMILTYCWC